uniref:Ribonuclease H-like domain-containing protein n=1 Tax=Tanacetum cinerariifolium TaxID=118510 RepID=A0A6L2L3J2_TANCI|nr:ribonuclease H-like domain-containing protein [Tanacetum cinerariifolium]
MQKRKNDVKARTTLLLALPDEHQLRFSKYKTAQELWADILKTFGGNEATKKTKKNLFKQQYGNFKAEGSETMEQTFNRLGNEEVNTASIPTASTYVSHASANIGAASISQDTACAYIASQSNGSQIKFEDITQIDEDDMEEMDIKWNMDLLSMRSALTATRWATLLRSAGLPGAKTGEGETTTDKEENHALVADEEAHTEFALIAKTSAECEVEARLAEFKKQEVKDCEKIRGLEFKVVSRVNRIKSLTNELELLKKEKEGLDSKLTGFQTASKDLDSLLKIQKSNKNKEGLGYNDTVTDYSRPSPAIESTSDDLQNRNPSVTKTGASPSNIISKPFIKFVKATDSPTENKADKVKTVKKPAVKYAELYRKPSKKSNVLSATTLRATRCAREAEVLGHVVAPDKDKDMIVPSGDTICDTNLDRIRGLYAHVNWIQGGLMTVLRDGRLILVNAFPLVPPSTHVFSFLFFMLT